MPLENLAQLENMSETASHNLWDASTRHIVDNLFGGNVEMFFGFLVAVTAVSVYIKTDDPGATLISLILAGSLLGNVFYDLGYVFLVATGVLLAFVIYTIYK